MGRARKRYPQGIPEKVRGLLEHELRLIEELHYEAYFLTVWDLVRFARRRGILCQGRGSAANSAVCYCLGITAVDPEHMDLLFERFISRERNEAPDIDVDLRARAPRGGAAIYLPQVRPGAGGDYGRGDYLSGAIGGCATWAEPSACRRNNWRIGQKFGSYSPGVRSCKR